MARSVGVELTPAHVRILSLEQAGKVSKILQFHEAPIAEGETPWEERAAAVPKTVIEKRLRPHLEAGADPVALDLDIAAVINAMLHAGAIDSDEPLLLIHGTPKFTKLVFIEGRKPRSIRTIRFSLKTGA